MIKNIDQLDWQPVTMPGAQLVKFRVLMGRDDQAPTFAIRQFEVEPHGHTPLHQHNYEHEVIVQNGEGVMKAGVDTHDIGPNDALGICGIKYRLALTRGALSTDNRCSFKDLL